jgi:heptosyltransferase-2
MTRFMLPLRNLEKYLRSWFLTFLRLSMSPLQLAPAAFEPAGVRNILVILRHQMGDAVLAFPMLKALRENFPAAHITLITKSSTNYRQVFRENLFYCNELWEYEFGFDKFMDLIHKLRRKTYELAVVPSSVSFSVTNHLIAYYARAKYRLGVASFDGEVNPAAFILNIKKDFRWRKVHQVKRYLDVISQLGITCTDTRIRIPVSLENLSYARNFFAKNFPDTSRFVVAVHPGARKPENVWSPENFAGLIFELNRIYNAYFFLSEGPFDHEYVRDLSNILLQRGQLRTPVQKGTLMDTIALLSLSDLFITNDTGIMHLAASLDTPMISLFAAADAREWAPIGDSKISLQSPTRAINDIKVEKVFEICRDLLGARRHNALS